MREIKFRAWLKEKDSGQWRMWYQSAQYLQSFLRRCCFVSSGGREHEKYGEYELMQFTGLLDKNKKEIYDGDIVRILYTDWPSQTPNEKGEYAMTLEEYKKSRSTIGYVSWDHHSTGWILRTKSKYSVDEDGMVMTSIVHGTHGEREIIGNIYENKELLT